jgi:hypothetical protein
MESVDFGRVPGNSPKSGEIPRNSPKIKKNVVQEIRKEINIHCTVVIDFHGQPLLGVISLPCGVGVRGNDQVVNI